MLEWFVTKSDPANLVLVTVIYWRLDRRLREIRDISEQ